MEALPGYICSPSLHRALLLVKLKCILLPKYVAFLCYSVFLYSALQITSMKFYISFNTLLKGRAFPNFSQLCILYCLFGGRNQCLLSIFYISSIVLGHFQGLSDFSFTTSLGSNASFSTCRARKLKLWEVKVACSG